MPQRAIATDGAEWLAADMTFDQDGRDSDFTRRTIFGMGQAGVCLGGVTTEVGAPSLTINVSGPLHFTVNGELDEIVTPGDHLLGINDTWYVIAKHLETDDTPATFYGAGSPPNKRRHMTPAIVIRNTGAAVLGDGEVNIATVVTGPSVISSFTDTRVIVPTVSAGNINLGAGRTIDGMDPSVHQATAARGDTYGHVVLLPPPETYGSSFGGAIGGAALAGLAMPWWKIDIYHFNQGTSYIPDSSDFASSPNGVGENIRTFRVPTMFGEFWHEGYGPLWKARLTMVVECSDVSPSADNAYVLAVNDAIRIKLNGSDLFTSTTDETGDHVISIPWVTGANTLEVFFSNGLNNFCFQFLSEFLRDVQKQFVPS